MVNYKNQLKNKIILITGGTGSFGNSLLKNLKNTAVKEIRVFSRDEKNRIKCENYIMIKNKIFYWRC